MKNYEFIVLSGRRVLKETIIGLFTKEIAESYASDFKQAARPLSGRPWALLTNLDEWKTSEQEVVAVVGKSLEWAKSNGMAFNANVIKSALHRIQLQRTVQEGGVSEIAKVFPVETEALAWLRDKGF